LFATQREFDRDSRTPTVCKRCEDLDIPSLYKLPFQPEYPHTIIQTRPVYGEGVDIVSKLGHAGTAEFLSNCPWCRMLVSSALRLIPAEWNELQIVREAEPLLTTSSAPSDHESGVDWPPLLDRLGLSTTRQPSLFLGVRETRPTIHDLGARMGISPVMEGRNAAYGARSVGPQPNYELLRSWIEECEHGDHHQACGDINHGQSFLDIISLVDVYERKVVPYSTLDRPDYVALSYVWGVAKQPSVRPGRVLPQLPRTVEDAMVVVESLGKRYLWVDALCIDQDNAKSKELQIAIMDRIYSSAWATIINLSGASADAGLPRVGGDASRVRQMRVETPHGEAFLSTLPALLAYAKQSPWTTRAWVFQEAVLSRRRLFFTHSQVYYECATGQRSEAWPQTPKEESPLCHHCFHLDFYSLQKGGDINVPYKRVHMYKTVLEEYKKRRMTYFGDSLNAFSALGAVLNRAFACTGQSTPAGGAVWSGLPTYDLPDVLSWRSSAPAPRDRRWPSWSWAAYPGPLIKGAVLPPRYHDWQLDEDRRPFFDVHFVAYPRTPKVALYRRNLDEGHRPPWKNTIDDVELLKIGAMPFEDATGLATLWPVLDASGAETCLGGFIAEGVVLSLALAGPATAPYAEALFDVFLGTAKCRLVAQALRRTQT